MADTDNTVEREENFGKGDDTVSSDDVDSVQEKKVKGSQKGKTKKASGSRSKKPAKQQNKKRLERSVGMEMPGNRYRIFLGVGTIPPVAERKHFVAKLKSLDKLSVTVLEGDKENADENIFVGEAGLGNFTLREDGKAEIEIEYALDDKGFLTITLADRITNTESYSKFALPQFMDEMTERIELNGLPVEQLSIKIDLLEQQISLLKGELEVRRVKDNS
jgi:molecular chaperone DnaK (HSP70)